MPLPRISIVTPSFNQSHFLEASIQSVLHQNYPNLEYVIIDGGSNDGSVEIIKTYDAKLHFWVSEADAGHGHALQKGFSHTSGEIMAWLNSDDKYTPWAFQAVAEIFTQFPQVMWIVGFNAWWNSRGYITSALRAPKNIYDFLLGNYAWIQQESVFWRRELWEKAGGYINQNYHFMVDGELWTRFFLFEDLYSVDCILSGYRTHQTNRANHYRSECIQEMQKAIAIMKAQCPELLLNQYQKLRTIQRFKQVPLGNYLPVSKLGQKLIYPSVFKAAAYKNIFWQDESWQERTLPFSV